MVVQWAVMGGVVVAEAAAFVDFCLRLCPCPEISNTQAKRQSGYIHLFVANLQLEWPHNLDYLKHNKVRVKRPLDADPFLSKCKHNLQTFVCWEIGKK